MCVLVNECGLTKECEKVEECLYLLSDSHIYLISPRNPTVLHTVTSARSSPTLTPAPKVSM